MMRVFIGLIETASFVGTYAKGLRSLGHETFTLVERKNPYYTDCHYDCVLVDYLGVAQSDAGILSKIVRRVKRGILLLRCFLKAVATCKVFIFLSGTSFLPRSLDYPILKLLGKRIVSVFLGSDVRYWYAVEQEMRMLELKEEVKPYLNYIKNMPNNQFLPKIRKIRAAERWADLILSQPDFAQLQTRPYMRVNVPLDLSQLRFSISERQRPLVIHAPSNRGIKGTEYILAAVEQLRQEGILFEFRMIENMPNAELRELLTGSDIVVDDVFSVTIGVLSLEAMATGNVVLVRYLSEYSRIPVGCPALNVTKDTLVDKLREVILDHNLRYQLASAGRPYVEAHHDHVQVVRQILNWLEPEGIQSYDFTPTFFVDHLVMPSQLLKKERNEIWRCRWQKLLGSMLHRITSISKVQRN